MPAGLPVRNRTFWVLVALAGATRLAVTLADHHSLIAHDVSIAEEAGEDSVHLFEVVDGR